ncbi:NAD-dependent protein deacetylase hst4 [Colletotrichum siamense]|uniref:NAD-dependent protein deacetylase hst4 n=1 Tax=Colletotrichum siamense TaxID=690259 RepID=A0A9P5BN29_COLSI|nr:NAD-dependent protein deacetylase hst4 [Colletotrichum siamense]KAF4929918.1 NAD-dependent protein deacetylase hst4 [Colletotrichum viniferum]KAI8151735.1 NAD-dependent protein deacetylase hst4 [Colletotrichum sp. SAR 10_71]KAI8228340.1 NAD-dependent protein deacetylase hst4 [Colletotrichum sp. SAR 10_77]KAJ4995346.1 NAD-dependent protein deacetylase hst4 [Colletotrichum sp. SAR 10_66]KAF4813868.1 NAD-dependent protein deacetylase hst4 [Colletotrichum siamense]
MDAPSSPSNMGVDAHQNTSSPSDSPLSSPLSLLSKSPSIPSSPEADLDASKRYPSPTSSMPSGAQSPVKLETADESVPAIKLDDPSDSINVNSSDANEGQPPRKRRKITPPKERTTEHLDLESCSENDEKLARLVSALKKRKKIVVIAGAGISVSAGIPDFRSKKGLFATLPNDHKMKGSGKHLFDASVYKHDSSTEKFHKMICDLSNMVKAAEPTPFHHLLASLAHEKRLLRLYSQNVDCIDTSMEPLKTAVPLNTKGPWPTTIQLHGSVEHMVCSKCADIKPLKTELFVGHEAPLCEECVMIDTLRTQYEQRRSHGIGRLRPRMVLYNEFNPDEEAIGKVSSVDLKSRPDAVIVVGTSLKIPGVRRLVKELCQVTRSRRDGFTAWINTDSEPQHNDFKDCWDLVVRGKCDDVAHWVSLPRFDEPQSGDSPYLSEEDEQQRRARLLRDNLLVTLPGSPTKSDSGSATENKKRKLVDPIQSIPTPTASPRIKAAETGKKGPKSKQSKLSFGGHQVASDTDVSAKKVKKTTVKKPRKSNGKKSNEPPKNALSQTFKTQKNRELADMPQETLAGKLDNQHYKFAEDKLASLLPPLRPEAQKPAKNIYYPQKPAAESAHDDKTPSSKSFENITRPALTERPKSSPATSSTLEGMQSDMRPATPMHERRKSETISPQSIPRGMEQLMD